MENKNNNNFTIVITGGGTGGHFYPLMSIISGVQKRFVEYFPNKNLKIFYIGSQYGIEKKLITLTKYPYTLLNIKGLSRNFSLKSILNNLLLPFRILKSMRTVKKIFIKMEVDAVIGTGGYVTAIPGKIAIKNNIPLYLQEQNGYPGLTTRILSKDARILFYNYDEIKKHISDDVNLLQTGNITQENIRLINRSKALVPFRLSRTKFTIFIFGGSQGSRSINEYFLSNIKRIIEQNNVQFIWQTGRNNYSNIKNQLGNISSIFLAPYVYNMSEAYSSADLIISRAGALTIGEIQKMHVPSILIPLPSAAANHQYINAKSLEKIGASVIVEEKNINEKLMPVIKELVNDNDKTYKMREALRNTKQYDSIKIISTSILNDLKKNRN
ncbi:MAG: undecaprenyldiphospho-muramoylpentapeptide beta-N-acetylglucosaminyltransferase [Candidatus Marinimicrobia bacterium]|nr:undecaprenyldiphospho-muramoylpentapeptide beta-N-acetylglucosaminyltransferase [Candidatus Neomarinimicrobiota bacterium]